jgi:hypothetical protein
MPLIRRLPKRGFNNAAFHKTWAVVNLGDLGEFKAGSVVNEKVLRESQLVRGTVAGVKILGNGELKHALTLEVDKISASAREKIDKAGGTVTIRDRSASPAAPEQAEDAKASAPKAAGKASAKKSSSSSKARSKKKSSRKG